MITVEATVENARKVRQISVKHGLSFDARLDAILNNIPRETHLPNFNFVLKGYQADAVAWLEAHGGRGILGDEMGLGKTCILFAYAHKNNMFPMAVVCPDSLKYNWRNEIIAMTGNRYKINIVGQTLSRKAEAAALARHPNVVYSKVPTSGCDVYLINYDIVSANVENIEALNLKFLAADESQKLKNSSANRTTAVVRLATGIKIIKQGKRTIKEISGKGISSVVFASGTPIVNRPLELWTSVNTLAPWVPQFSEFKKFAFRYCAPVNNAFGWDFTGSSNADELNNLLVSHCMIRRLKQDVLKELPPKTHTTIPLDFDRREYDKVAAAFKGIDWKGGIEALVKFGGNAPKSDEAIVAVQKLREIAGYSKLESSVEWIRDYCEHGEKLVVFAHHRQVINNIKSALEEDSSYNGKVEVIYGGMSNQDRDAAVARFQNDATVRVIIVGIDAGGAGLTLTAAKSVAFVQLPWSAGSMNQCSDRVHRIGQTASNVQVFVLTAENTIEDDMASLIMSKANVMDEVLDGGRVVNSFDITAR
jgi:SWI/SNF-related matrix-associated actin-dependent regulator 1 of chromatin subfamily A